MLVALLLLSYRCIVTINVLWLFLVVALIGLRCVIMVFPDHTHLLFYAIHHNRETIKLTNCAEAKKMVLKSQPVKAEDNH